MPKTVPFAIREVKRLNDELDRYPRLTSFDRLCAIADRVVWLQKFRKAPHNITQAMIIKITALFDGTWYGDEPQDAIINDYIKKGV